MSTSAHGADPPVPTDESVLADGPLEPGQPGDQHHHDQHQVGAGEPGQPAPGDEPAPGAASEPRVSPVIDQTEGDAEAETGQRGEGVGEPGPWGVAWAGLAPGWLSSSWCPDGSALPGDSRVPRRHWVV